MLLINLMMMKKRKKNEKPFFVFGQIFCYYYYFFFLQIFIGKNDVYREKVDDEKEKQKGAFRLCVD